MPERSGIRVLPPKVVNRIAAGEVVERPASIVKELVENSIDAGATRVEVEVRDGGTSYVRVVDDGQGMGPEDLALAFVSHATSKLGDVDELEFIGTLGFRGEALASIGAVGNARITSRRPGEASGHTVENRFGEVSEVRPVASPAGTTVEVSDLFRNVPARRKFLKSAGAEMARVTVAVHRFGISTPHVEIRLTHGGRRVAAFPAGAGRRDRIALAFGRELREELIEAEGAADGVELRAFLAPPSRTWRDTTRMIFFLNGRFIRDRTLLHALRHAYSDLIFGPRHPIAFCFFTMDPALVDQNVHPAKREVRFRNASALHALVRRTAREALTSGDLAHPVPVDDAPAPATDRERRVRDAVADYLGRAERRPPEPGPGLFDRGTPGAGKPAAGGDVGRAVDFLQVRNSFLVLEDDDGITIVDQHALHERVLYDRFRRRYLAGETPVQRLLRPAVVEVDPTELEGLLEVREDLARIGLLIDRFGRDGIAVHGTPGAAADADPAELVEGVLERLREERPADAGDLAERLLATMACKTAVKAGDGLGREQVAELLAAAEELEHSATCPHGRPTTLRLTYDALERHFRRRG